MGRKKRHTVNHQEVIPLIDRKRWRKVKSNVIVDTEEYEESPWVDIFVSPDKRNNGTALIVGDAVLIIVLYLQLFALLQSLALRWPWPEEWLSWACLIFFANADVWEFLKIYTTDVFKYVQDYYIPSAELGISYTHLLIGWGALLALVLLIYIVLYGIFSRIRSRQTLLRLATLQRVYIVGAQFVAIPVGLVCFRLLHCTGDDTVDVDNTVYCYRNTHWAYLAPSLAVILLLFVIFPAWLIVKAKAQLLNMTAEMHESYLQLKEMEYLHGLNTVWVVSAFHVFASFKRPGVHYRAATIACHGLILVLYGALFNYSFYQIVSITCLLFIMFFAFLVLRPFRVTALNVMLIISYFCLSINGMLGCLKAYYRSDALLWLLPYYQFIVLLIVNGLWLLCCVLFFTVLSIKLICCKARSPLWPNTKFEKLSPESRKYVKAIIICRLLNEKAMGVHPMFSPVHDIARFIHIINAYCREAELTGDPLLNVLWDVLDELIQTHTRLAPKSLFAESTKESIRLTATELMKMLPTFVRRLAQREYDFILMNPIKRRILLKLYCMGLFLNGRRPRVERSRLMRPAMSRVWRSPQDEPLGGGYLEDMYPPREALVTNRQYPYDADVLLALEDGVVEDDEAVIEETEAWLRRQGVEPGRPTAADLWLADLDGPGSPSSPDAQDLALPGAVSPLGSSRASSAVSGRPGSAGIRSQSRSDTEERSGSRGLDRPPSALSRPPSGSSVTAPHDPSILPGMNPAGDV